MRILPFHLLYAKICLQREPALLTFVTAGYPLPVDTVSIMLAMQAGGVDIIELGVPFSDPIADGPAIQETSQVHTTQVILGHVHILRYFQVALEHNVSYADCLNIVKEARSIGLVIPIILMGACTLPLASFAYLITPHSGYYNPLLAYGEERSIQDAHDCGANGFIVVDLPPEEAIPFREKCTRSKWVIITFRMAISLHPHSISFVPLITPSTTIPRIKYLCSIADTFIYVVSKV